MPPELSLTRQQILNEISQLESRLIELRDLLPSTIKSFYRFRCHPERHVFIYAGDRKTAEEKLRERMDTNYGDNWSIASGVVDVFNDPKIAACNSPGNLMRALSQADAQEFLADYRADQIGRAEEKGRENLAKSQLEIDIASHERHLRVLAASQ